MQEGSDREGKKGAEPIIRSAPYPITDNSDLTIKSKVQRREENEGSRDDKKSSEAHMENQAVQCLRKQQRKVFQVEKILLNPRCFRI